LVSSDEGFIVLGAPIGARYGDLVLLVVDADDEATIRAPGRGPVARGLADDRQYPAVVGLASRVARELTPTIADPEVRVAGFHLYRFNEVART
jgi:hypothetical protein